MRGEQTMAHESGAHRLLAIDQLSSRPRVPSLRRALSGRPAAARPHLLGSVSGDGLRPVDLSGEFARHRNLFTFVAGQSLSLGIPWQGGAFDAGGRERIARLAHLRRLRPPADCDRARIVCPRAHGRRSGAEPVCSGFDNHRSVSGAVSVGPVSGEAKLPSRCTRCWTYAATFRRLFALPMARCMMSTYWTRSCRKPEPSMSWIAATLISNGCSC